jgi:hypothetical protein
VRALLADPAILIKGIAARYKVSRSPLYEHAGSVPSRLTPVSS